MEQVISNKRIMISEREREREQGKRRKRYLDVAKLILVLFVVHNHAKTVSTPISNTISILHMPAFFLVYGMAVSERQVRGREWLRFLKTKAQALLVPYVLWALIYSGGRGWTFLKNVLVGNNQSLGTAGTNQVLWFLPCMFMSTILFQAYSDLYLRAKREWHRWVCVIGVAAICVAVSHIFCGFKVGGRFFGWDIAFMGCLFMIVGSRLSDAVEKMKQLPVWAKLLGVVLGVGVTDLIAAANGKYVVWSGLPNVTMALGVYGREDLFLCGAIIGTITVILISMLL